MIPLPVLSVETKRMPLSMQHAAVASVRMTFVHHLRRIVLLNFIEKKRIVMVHALRSLILNGYVT